MTEAFYVRTSDGVFDSSPKTAGPWGPDAQHAGPPSALLIRAVEQFEPRPESRIARVSVDVLASIPIEPLTVRITPIKQGRRTELVEATAHVGGRAVLTARVWRLATTPGTFPVVGAPEDLGQLPDVANVQFPGAYMDGYMSAIDWRFIDGSFATPGPARLWAKPTIDLVGGEAMSGWQRALTVCDSASGASLALNPREYPAINCDLTVTLERDPVGEWIGLDAITRSSPDGGAVTSTIVHDRSGRVGVASQTLFASDLTAEANA